MKGELISKTLAQIVTENHEAASILENYTLDFCCKGKRSLKQACEEKNLEPGAIAAEIENAGRERVDAPDFDTFTLPQLIDHIVSVHHVYLRSKLPEIFGYLQKICAKHGEHHPELYEIFEKFIMLRQELEQHLLKEEVALFPRIKLLANCSDACGRFVQIESPMAVLEFEHEETGEILLALRQLSNDFTPPGDACTTYRLTYAALGALEKDLHEHIHLENNILFPKAIELQNKIHQADFK